MTSKYEELANELDGERNPGEPSYCGPWKAADAIRELLALVRELDEAIEPFAEVAICVPTDSHEVQKTYIDFYNDTFRKARTAHEKALLMKEPS